MSQLARRLGCVRKLWDRNGCVGEWDGSWALFLRYKGIPGPLQARPVPELGQEVAEVYRPSLTVLVQQRHPVSEFWGSHNWREGLHSQAVCTHSPCAHGALGRRPDVSRYACLQTNQTDQWPPKPSTKASLSPGLPSRDNSSVASWKAKCGIGSSFVCFLSLRTCWSSWLWSLTVWPHFLT